jgi:hypothetical protein
MTDDATLLVRHVPRLVVLPQDPTMHRPWKGWFEKVRARHGDYHPCAAEFFLSFVIQRARPRSFWAGVFGDPHPAGATGLETLRSLVALTTPEGTLEWEIDVGPIQSQDADGAWKAYDPMLRAEAFSPTVYGRCIRRPDRIYLAYWFLYMYNDAPNKHEGDWEMVTLELDTEERPVQGAFASHRTGSRRAWGLMELDGDRPIVYVARGSHASYSSHVKGGHRARSPIVPHKGLPIPLEAGMQAIAWVVQKAIVVLRLEDQTPVRPGDQDETPPNLGEFIDPRLVVMPELEQASAESDFWWMRLRCPWGSRHTRVFGDSAPDPPWEQGRKWSDPSGWMATLELEA